MYGYMWHFYVLLYLKMLIFVVIFECICCGRSRLCHFHLRVHVNKYCISFRIIIAFQIHELRIKLLLEDYKHDFIAYISGIIAIRSRAWVYLLQPFSHDKSTSPYKNGFVYSRSPVPLSVAFYHVSVYLTRYHSTCLFCFILLGSDYKCLLGPCDLSAHIL